MKVPPTKGGKEMRYILVQDCQTKLFLNKHCLWTTEPGEANNFGTSMNAFVFCQQHGIKHVLRFNASRSYDLTVPLQSELASHAE